ncbi:MAG: stage III sporulation protein AB [Clostridia bacterium]|nr:stage III sporulation protein AB [Clostridia bacterium]
MLLFKISGIFLIVIVCSAAGLLKSLSIKNRSKKLSAFCDGLNTLYEYIEQGGCELDIAIKISFSKCVFLQHKNGRFLCLDNDLKGEDKAMIDGFFDGLGSSAKKAECDRINSFKLKMKTHLKEAENDVSQKSKIYQTFGICIGLAIGILLI